MESLYPPVFQAQSGHKWKDQDFGRVDRFIIRNSFPSKCRIDLIYAINLLDKKEKNRLMARHEEEDSKLRDFRNWGI
jgi:hypothetical protein